MDIKKSVKRVIPKQLFNSIEPYGHWAEAIIVQNKSRFPAKNLKVIGVTGTDGKTTTCNLIAAILRHSGQKVAMITTASVDYGDGKGEQKNPTQLTTGSSAQLNKLLIKIKNNNVEWLVLEVSSHALNQRRVWGIPFYLVVHTNMSHEHLDYHGTFAKYQKAKQRLFKACNFNKNGLRTGIINGDDKTAHYFAASIAHPLTYGINNHQKKYDFLAKNIHSDLNGNYFDVISKNHLYKIKSPLIGEFNIYNILAAVAVADTIGLDKHKIEQAITKLPFVAGRMMTIESGQKFKVIIDYAVTPAALKNVISTTRNLNKDGDIHIVFGATGDRDKTKRPKMGAITAELADKVYLTDDETYTENPSSIRQEVFAGVKKIHKKKVKIFDDRKTAIAAALKNAKPNDVVLITGIGHQTSRNMGGKKIAYSDIETTKSLL